LGFVVAAGFGGFRFWSAGLLQGGSFENSFSREPVEK